ncbi:MAG TPA: hypothetical protein VFY26_20790 [Anaerolineales bacterium]|nr:hypothetical protein [Anaerolineales bacterium]
MNSLDWVKISATMKAGLIDRVAATNPLENFNRNRPVYAGKLAAF